MTQLTHRTQLLLDEERHRRLQACAQRSGQSVGAMIRAAIDAMLATEEQDAARREAGRRLLEAPAPAQYDREPGGDTGEGEGHGERFDRWCGDDDAA